MLFCKRRGICDSDTGKVNSWSFFLWNWYNQAKQPHQTNVQVPMANKRYLCSGIIFYEWTRVVSIFWVFHYYSWTALYLLTKQTITSSITWHGLSRETRAYFTGSLNPMVMSEGLHQNNVNYSQRPMWVESQGERSRNDYNLLITKVSISVVITSQRCLSIRKLLHTVNHYLMCFLRGIL